MKRILLFGIISLLFASFALSQASREIKKTVDLNKDGELAIDTYKGSITIATWDKPQVEITARIEADPDMWGHRSDDAVKETDVRIEGSGTEVRIKTDYDEIKNHSSFFGLFGDDSGNLPSVHYTITMPATARLDIKDYKSKSRIADVKGSIEFNTYKGEVDFTNIAGAIDLETYKGDVTIEYAKFSGENRFKTEKGHLRVHMPSDASFDLDADLGRRADFSSEFETGFQRRHRESSMYHTTINGGGPSLHVETEKGDIRLLKKG
ncbi:MAG TPA: DUF4097 family beta strand repeat-containing protein [Bacteroidota bacterium]|nr:DUF4097 family beta strand repeat-containing protein [Bacteroidota bacterium]